MREVTLQIEEPAYRHLVHSLRMHQATAQWDACACLAALIVKAIETNKPRLLIIEEHYGQESNGRYQPDPPAPGPRSDP